MIESNITSQTINTSTAAYAPDSLNPRILVVDDNCEIHNDFRKILSPSHEQQIDDEFDAIEALFDDEPCQVQPESSVTTIDSANQGEQAIELVRQSLADGLPYSLAFIDVRMPPGLDGIETTRRIWELDPEIQVVICSAYSDYSWHEIVEKLGNSNRFLILKKPFDNIEVRQISSVLHSRWIESRSDVLTGALNRRAFSGHLTRQRKLAIDSGDPLSCVMVDLDYFKRINDRFGHAAGDAVLVAVADVLCRFSEKSDLVCRYGGEEFCVLLKGKTEAEAVEWAEKTRAALSQLVVDTGEFKIGVSGSFGIACLHDKVMDDNRLFIDAADQALYSAKSAGRNQCVAYSSIGKFEQYQSDSQSSPAAATTKEAPTNRLIPVTVETGDVIGMLPQQDLLPPLSAKNLERMTTNEVAQTDNACRTVGTPTLDVINFLARVSESQSVVLKDA